MSVYPVVALNFSGSIYRFNNREIRHVRRQVNQVADEYVGQDGYIRQKLIGKSFESFIININLNCHGIDMTELMTKIQAVFDAKDAYNQPVTMRLYYKYYIDNTAYTDVKFDRNTFDLNLFKSGHKYRVVSLKFIQTVEDVRVQTAINPYIQVGV